VTRTNGQGQQRRVVMPRLRDGQVARLGAQAPLRYTSGPTILNLIIVAGSIGHLSWINHMDRK